MRGLVTDKRTPQDPHWSELPWEDQIRFWDEQVNTQIDSQPVEPEPVKKRTRRRRGDHSTACKCPQPSWYRPENFKKLPGEIGHAYSRLVKRDTKTGKETLRIRVSKNPLFVHLRTAAGRQRAFRPERRNLIDALIPLLISSVDMATHIITLNVGRLADQLSTRDAAGNVTEPVTTPRVCRLIQELLRYGLLEVVEDVQWDAINRCYFPKHVAIGYSLWRLLGVNMDKLIHQREERLQAEYEGILEPGEVISVKAARKRWLERMRYKTFIRRREEAVKGKWKKKLQPLPFDERMYTMADHLMRTLPRAELHGIQPDVFERLVYDHLAQLNLALHQQQAPPLH